MVFFRYIFTFRLDTNTWDHKIDNQLWLLQVYFHFLSYIIFLMEIFFDYSVIFELIMAFVCHFCDSQDPCDYFQWTNQTMRLTNAEFTETTHSTFKMFERKHKFWISRKIGTPIHQEMALKSLVWHNSKRAGFVSPQEFRIRKSSPRVWGSPLSSPRLK